MIAGWVPGVATLVAAGSVTVAALAVMPVPAAPVTSMPTANADATRRVLIGDCMMVILSREEGPAGVPTCPFLRGGVYARSGEDVRR